MKPYDRSDDATDELLARATAVATERGLPLETWLRANAGRGVATWEALREAGVPLDTSTYRPLDTAIVDLPLSTRARNILENSNLKTLRALIPCSRRDLLKAKYCVPATVAEIERVLAANGMLLSADRDEPPDSWYSPWPLPVTEPDEPDSWTRAHWTPVEGAADDPGDAGVTVAPREIVAASAVPMQDRPARPELHLDFPPRLVCVSDVVDVTRVPVPSARKVTYARDARGREWVHKSVADDPTVLLGESLGWLLGRELGVPLPEAAVCTSFRDRAWLSRRVPHVASHWQPSLAHLVENLDGFAAMLVLDFVLVLEERPDGNILLAVPDAAGGRLRAFAIGYGHAHAAQPARYVERAESRPAVRNVRRYPFDALAAPAALAAERATSLPADLLRELVDEAFWVARIPRPPEYLEVLRYRLGLAPRRIEEYLRSLEAGP